MGWEEASCQAQELPKTEQPPSLIHLLPIGAISGRDGREWVLDDPERLLKVFARKGVDLLIDFEHQSEMQKGAQVGPIPAAGWITGLEIRDGGLWGRVRWTNKAANMITAREYRYISPTFRFDKDTKRVVALTGAGLVHRPNLQLTALAKEQDKMSHDTDLGEFATALGLPADANRISILAAINASQEPDPAKFVPIEAVRDLLNDRNSKQAKLTASEVETAVNGAIDQGVITPGMRDWATALCSADPESFASFVTTSPAPFAHLFEKTPLPTLPEKGRSRAFGEAELALCAQLGIDPSDLMD